MIFKDFVALQTIFLLAGSNAKTGKTQQCYVCVSEGSKADEEVTKMFPGAPSCDRFRPEKKYEKDCPSSLDGGCLTQMNGPAVARLCTQGHFEQCNTVNDVLYCYCKGELCNGKNVSTSSEPAGNEKSKEEPIGDDEDSAAEGSGLSPSDIRQTSGEKVSESDFSFSATATATTTTRTTEATGSCFTPRTDYVLLFLSVFFVLVLNKTY